MFWWFLGLLLLAVVIAVWLSDDFASWVLEKEIALLKVMLGALGYGG